MLCEIYCEEFHQKKIHFRKGFNVVLGTNTGDNSIGKSTFMLIIDFVYGGSAYSKSSDILHNVGNHTIFFKFMFNGTAYYFSREFIHENIIWKCDSNYKQLEHISQAEYCQWLSSQYELNLFDLSFRDAVGRYIRAYGKENCNEKLPLHVCPAERCDNAITALLKLFDKYKEIYQIKNKAKDSNEKLKAFTKAQKLNYISKINKHTFKTNQKAIISLQKEIDELENDLQYGLLDVTSLASEEAIRLKKDLSQAKRLRSVILNKLTILEDNEHYKFSPTTESFAELTEFFPNCNLKHIDEIENFHKKIVNIFKEELKAEKLELLSAVKDYNIIIDELEGKLKELIHNPKLSKAILQKHTDTLKLIERLQNENRVYIQQHELEQQKQFDQKLLQAEKSKHLGMIEKQINQEMEQINQQLYVEKYHAPIIHFTESSYSFNTPNDTGTGIAYKGLVVFDLAIAKLTKLPILVHDSVVLKQISDDAIEKLLSNTLPVKSKLLLL